MSKLRDILNGMSNGKVIKCECGEGYSFSEDVVKKNKILDFTQVLVVCPHCGAETHAYYTSNIMEKKTKRLKTKRKHQYDSAMATRKYLEEQRKFESFFENFQVECSDKVPV